MQTAGGLWGFEMRDMPQIYYWQVGSRHIAYYIRAKILRQYLGQYLYWRLFARLTHFHHRIDALGH